MLDNLKIALRRQRRLITIFLLTIFVPSLALGIFGIRAIRSERFRQAKELEDEHKRTAKSIKSLVSAKFEALETILQDLVKEPDFREKNIAGTFESIRDDLGKNPLVESAFVAFDSEGPFFPLFQSLTLRAQGGPPPAFSGAVQKTLSEAEETEFARKDLGRAAALYRAIGAQTRDPDLKARTISNEARCLMKLGRFEDAAAGYERIDREYPRSIGPSGIPLALVGRIQAVTCFRESKDFPKAAAEALRLLEDILRMRWDISETQFKAYVSLSEEAFKEILPHIVDAETVRTLEDRFDRSKDLFREKLEQWSEIRSIEEEIIPDLRRRLSASPRPDDSFHYAKTLGDETYLILGESLSESKNRPDGSLLGIRIQAETLLEDIRSRFGEGIEANEGPNVVISDLEGGILLGERPGEVGSDAVTEFFGDNFPPWKIEIFRGPNEGIGSAGLKRSFYFWTIITLVVVLSFGAILTARTIAHEMEILKLKSDFVASVSHEFKTPLTSMRALLERLRGGKVKEAGKMDEYFSLLSRNTDQLARLVKNLLDFSKIEEGKREYHFAPADITAVVARLVNEFKSGGGSAGVNIRLQAAEHLPLVPLDEEAVAQAVSNLLDNASKFSQDQRIICVSVGRDGGDVFVEVEDKGIGIPRDELEKIFEKFYQGRNAARQSARGTGLGLTLAKHTVEAHGGQVTVTSRPGEGSTFRLTFPIRRE